MVFNTNKHRTPDNCTHADLLATMILNVQNEIGGYVEAGFSQADALARVRKESCAGQKVWDAVEQTLID